MSVNHHYPEIVIATVKRDKFTLSWIQGNIFRVDVHESAYLNVDDIREIQKYKADLVKDELYCVLFVCPHFGDLTKESREYLAMPETNQNAVAKAIITPNIGTRMLTDFFISVNKPPVIHKAFSDIPAAYKWMRMQIDLAIKTS
jgi:hypothetical protein